MADLDPYAELGVPRDADDGAVKRAFRAKANEAHPDKGGSGEKFHAIRTAYDILTDPKRRERFDRTGATDKPLDPRQASTMAMAKMAVELVSRVEDVAHNDLHAVMVSTIAANMALIRRRRADTERAIAKKENAMGRFKHAGAGENVIARILEASIAQSRQELARIDDELAIGTGILEVLAEYSYEFDQAGVWPGGLQAGQGLFDAMQAHTGMGQR